MRSPFQMHDSFGDVSRERKRIERILRSFFGIGGLLWLPVFFVPFSDIEHHHAFRVHQYQLYVLLLSLWGYQSRRDFSRYRILVTHARSANCEIADVPYSMISNPEEEHFFSVLKKRGHDRKYWPVIFTWSFLVAALGIIVMQLRLIF